MSGDARKSLRRLKRKVLKQVFGIEPPARPPKPLFQPELLEALRQRVQTRTPHAERADACKHVVILTGGAYFLSLYANETVMAHALEQHGARCTLLLCDQFIPKCACFNITQEGPPPCAQCRHTSDRWFEVAGLTTRTLSGFVTPQTAAALRAEVAQIPSIDAIFALERDGIPLGQIARGSVFRYLLSSDVTAAHLPIAREYLLAALLMFEACKTIERELKPDAVLVSHGIYVEWGVFAEYFGRRGVPLTVYGKGYRKGTLVVTPRGTYHRMLIEEPVALWENTPFGAAEEAVIDDYLGSKVTGRDDRAECRYQPEVSLPEQQMIRELQIEPGKFTVGLFTNLVWDGAVVLRQPVFENQMIWLRETVEFFRTRPDWQLVVRAHPAEAHARPQTRQQVIPTLLASIPDLPPNVKLVPPDSLISSYTLLKCIQVGLVYASKVGLELVVRGLPVVVAGDALYRDKGFTADARSVPHYHELLGQLDQLHALDAATIRRAKHYAHHFFFRRCLAIDLIREDGKGFKFESLADLGPGKNEALDRFCRDVLSGGWFI